MPSCHVERQKLYDGLSVVKVQNLYDPLSVRS